MKIFFSHSSRDKPLIREIRNHLPNYVKTWLDEEELLLGQNVENSIFEAIKSSGFVVLFLSEDALESEWVQKELSMSLEHEKKVGHDFILPVLLADVWERVQPPEFQQRRYIKCFDLSDAGVKAFSELLSSEIFRLLIDRLSSEQSAKLAEQKETEKFTANLSALADGAGSNFDKGQISLREKLQESLNRYPSAPVTLKLQRLTPWVRSRLSKLEKEDPKEMSSDPSDVEVNGAILGFMMTAYGNGAKTLLRRVDEEIVFWESNQDDVDPEEVWKEIVALAAPDAPIINAG